MKHRLTFLGRLVLHRAWIFELVSSAFLLTLFFYLWRHLETIPAILPALSSYPSSLIPILAITNAISLLGANTYLARYNAFDKINEIFSTASRLLNDSYDRMQGHPRDNKFARREFYLWLLNRTFVEQVELTNQENDRFTLRPYWDGVWFFGSEPYNKIRNCDLRTFLSFHELLLCSIFVLKIVSKLRAGNLALVGNGTSGSQGSIWFVDRLKSYEKKINATPATLDRREAFGIIMMAEASPHYMFEEFRAYQEDQGWEEYRKLRFIDNFIEYLIWLNYFQAKFLKLRFSNIQPWLERNKRKCQFSEFEKRSNEIGDLKAKLFELRETIVPRRAIAERIIQIRLGSFVPIILTALALFGYTIFQPVLLSLGQPLYSDFGRAALYSLICTAMAENFIFGLWLLIPWRNAQRKSLIH